MCYWRSHFLVFNKRALDFEEALTDAEDTTIIGNFLAKSLCFIAIQEWAKEFLNSSFISIVVVGF